ncbi:hypothetical protein ACS0TY_031790 [Phlomoides rotata]
MGCSFILPYFRNPFIARRWSPIIFSGAAGTAAAPATSKMVKAIRIHELGGPEENEKQSKLILGKCKHLMIHGV